MHAASQRPACAKSRRAPQPSFFKHTHYTPWRRGKKSGIVERMPPVDVTYKPSPIILELGAGFADPVKPAPFPKAQLRFRNQRWAASVGLGELEQDEWKRHFASFEPLPKNLLEPLALRYHGHQFRSYNPDLGDGRGFLFAQLQDKAGRVLDLGTKGSGQTPYSRSGDGRLTLKGAVREVLATEMLEALGVNTSKTFSVFETFENLIRHDEPSPTRAGVLVRLNHSHIRFGTFQRLAFHGEKELTSKLVQYSIEHYFPHLQTTDENKRVPAFLREVSTRAADLTACWMTAGFVHGVLNTDNMNIAGESFDYGPYRFLPKYDTAFTAAYFDHSGLYAYGRQPESVLWNLEQLAAALTPIAPEAALIEALQIYPERFNTAIVEKLIERMGLVEKDEIIDGELFMAVFDFLSASQMGFEQFFHDWYGGLASRKRALKSPEAKSYDGPQFVVFIQKLEGYKATQATLESLKNDWFSEHPKPSTLLIDEIEWIWKAIADSDDWSRFEAKISEIRQMGKVYGRYAV
jgi:uncharacterized protein YdiU (UPF0061 family)